jgi:hypothetical protein
METATSTCPSCSLPILSEFYFCPNCGKAVRSKPIVLSIAKLIGICLLSFFLPPFGLFHAIKYVRQTNTKTKVVGWVAIALTITAYGISIYSFLNIMEQFNNTYGKLLQY